ncbi:MAG TPA: hypothetical protein PKA42_01445 [Candidatus Paceibacterota bacterium]|nr:hypothetical protein [Candidatus Paceibacterota bacterium]
MKQKTLIVLNILILILLFVLTDPTFKFLNDGALAVYEPNIEPLFLLFISSFLSALVILFRKNIFQKWFKKFLVWYFPLSLLLTFTFPTSGYTMIHRFDAAVMFGVGMILITLGMVIYSFYRPRKLK